MADKHFFLCAKNAGANGNDKKSQVEDRARSAFPGGVVASQPATSLAAIDDSLAQRKLRQRSHERRSIRVSRLNRLDVHVRMLRSSNVTRHAM